MIARALALTVSMVAVACGRGTGPATPPVLVVTDRASATGAIGKTVRVSGTAVDDKATAVVDAGDLSVHCLEPAPWPPERTGRLIVVEGMLERSDELASRTTSTGLVTQGNRGAIFLIRRCTIR